MYIPVICFSFEYCNFGSVFIINPDLFCIAHPALAKNKFAVCSYDSCLAHMATSGTNNTLVVKPPGTRDKVNKSGTVGAFVRDTCILALKKLE